MIPTTSGDDSDDDAAAVDEVEEENNNELLIMMQHGRSGLGIFAAGDAMRAHPARVSLKKRPKSLKGVDGAGSTSTDKRHAKRTKLLAAVGTSLPFFTTTAPKNQHQALQFVKLY